MFTRKLCRLVLNIILTLIFWTGLFLVTLIYAPFCGLRKILQSAAQCFQPTWRGILTLEEGLYRDRQAHDVPGEEPSNSTNIMLLALIAGGEPNLEKIRNFFQEYVLDFKNYRGERPYDKFYCYKHDWLGYTFWKRVEHLNLRHHIRYLEEFYNRDETTQEDLEIYMGEYSSKPFPWKTPPWEILLVRDYLPTRMEGSSAVNRYGNFRSEKRFAMLLRWHHSLADGYSMGKIVINILGGETPSEFMCGNLGNDFSLWQNAHSYLNNFLRLGCDGFKQLVLDADRNVWRVAEETMTGSCHLVASSKMPYNLARTVSKKRGVSITTVVLTAVAGGIRNYFVESGQERRIPKVMRVRVPMPCSGHQLNGLENYRSFTHLNLPVGQPEAWKRLYCVHRNIEDLRHSLLPGLVWLIGPMHAALPSGFELLDFADKRTTLTGWNFRGPKQELLLLGEYPAHELLCYHPRLQTDAAIGLAVLSYNGTIRFSVCIDKTLFPHRESALKLIRLIEQEFLSLQQLKGDQIQRADAEL